MKKKLGIIALITLLISSFLLIRTVDKSYDVKANSITPINLKGNKLPSYQHFLTFKFKNNDEASYFASSYHILLNDRNLKIEFSPAKKATINGSLVDIYLPVLQPYNNYSIGNNKYVFYIENFSDKVNLVKNASQCLLIANSLDQCMNAYFHSKVISDKGPQQALTELNALVKSDSALLQKCHAWAHSLGEASAWYFKDWQGAIKYAKNSCNFGYYHGVQEGLAEIIDTPTLKTELNSICSVFVLEMVVVDCAHGLGHLAYWRTGGDYKLSMDICSALKRDEKSGFDGLVSCGAGVTMNWAIEHQDEKNSTGVNNFVKPDLANTFNLCANVSNEFLRAGCYNYIHFAEVQSKEVLSNVINQCITLKESLSLNWCVLGYARDYGHFDEVKPLDVIKECERTNNIDAIWTCAQGIVYVKSITTAKPGTAKIVCEYFTKIKFDEKNQINNCKIIEAMEKRRIGSEGAILQLNTGLN